MRLACKAPRVILALQAKQAPRVILAPKGPREILVIPAPRDRRATPVLQDLVENRDLQARTVQASRSLAAMPALML